MFVIYLLHFKILAVLKVCWRLMANIFHLLYKFLVQLKFVPLFIWNSEDADEWWIGILVNEDGESKGKMGV